MQSILRWFRPVADTKPKLLYKSRHEWIAFHETCDANRLTEIQEQVIGETGITIQFTFCTALIEPQGVLERPCHGLIVCGPMPTNKEFEASVILFNQLFMKTYAGVRFTLLYSKDRPYSDNTTRKGVYHQPSIRWHLTASDLDSVRKSISTDFGLNMMTVSYLDDSLQIVGHVSDQARLEKLFMDLNCHIEYEWVQMYHETPPISCRWFY